VIQVLSRRRKNNPLLLGEPGVGKTAIVEGLAQRIVSGDVPRSLADCHLVSLDMAALVAGTSQRGQFEERLKMVLDEVTASEGATDSPIPTAVSAFPCLSCRTQALMSGEPNSQNYPAHKECRMRSDALE
jgi:hypothetical protein